MKPMYGDLRYWVRIPIYTATFGVAVSIWMAILYVIIMFCLEVFSPLFGFDFFDLISDGQWYPPHLEEYVFKYTLLLWLIWVLYEVIAPFFGRTTYFYRYKLFRDGEIPRSEYKTVLFNGVNLIFFQMRWYNADTGRRYGFFEINKVFGGVPWVNDAWFPEQDDELPPCFQQPTAARVSDSLLHLLAILAGDFFVFGLIHVVLNDPYLLNDII